MFAGPLVLGWIPVEGLVADLGDIGLLSLMFLAGLSFNIRAFMENRSNAIVYGLLGFFIPFVMSYYFAISFIELEDAVYSEPTTPNPALPLWLGLLLLAAFCFWLLPRITQWFFVKVGHTRTSRFVFALAGMGSGSVSGAPRWR
jgi:Kef-type K+ transport system membrane component KefB